MYAQCCYAWAETDTTDGVRSEIYPKQSEPRLSINGIPKFCRVPTELNVFSGGIQ